jgi:peptidoglycan L-alanyl-D-glutamate endopeptidase CwlK
LPKFSKRSKDKLETCHPDLQEIMNEAVKHLDISIISGHRGAVEQDTLYEDGFSQKKFPDSKHNFDRSKAVDVMYWNKEKPRIRWHNQNQMCIVAGYIMAIAKQKKIKLKWGGDWNKNLITEDNWFDGGHFELEDE